MCACLILLKRHTVKRMGNAESGHANHANQTTHDMPSGDKDRKQVHSGGVSSIIHVELWAK